MAASPTATVEFRSVSFRIGGNLILDNLSFTISPAETRQGNIVFDVPLTSYRLRLTDGGEPGTEKFVWVEIPLHIDVDTSIEVPGAGR